MINTKDLLQNLEVILTDDKFKKVNEILPKFEDIRLIRIATNVSSKVISQQGTYAPEWGKILRILDNVLLKEYKIDPTLLSPLYGFAMSEDKYEDYGHIREHINTLNAIAPAIYNAGLYLNREDLSNNRYVDSLGSTSDERPKYSFSSESYGGILLKLLSDKERKYTITETLDAFKTHFQKIKETNIDMSELIKNGYSGILDKIYNNNKIKKIEDLNNGLLELERIMNNLDNKEFDLCSKSTLNTLKNMSATNVLGDLDLIAEYSNRNPLILNLGFRLKE